MNYSQNTTNSDFPWRLLVAAAVLVMVLAALVALSRDLHDGSNIVRGTDLRHTSLDDPSQDTDDRKGPPDRRLKFPIHRNKAIWQSDENRQATPQSEFGSRD